MGRSVLSLRDRAREGCLLESRTLGDTPCTQPRATRCSRPRTMPSPASKQPSTAALTPVTGGSERYDRPRHWWTDHHDHCAAALL